MLSELCPVQIHLVYFWFSCRLRKSFWCTFYWIVCRIFSHPTLQSPDGLSNSIWWGWPQIKARLQTPASESETTCHFWLSRITYFWFRNKLWKWLQWNSWVKKMLNLRPNVWKFARRWLTSHCHSASPSTSGPTSPSPWTPGKKKLWRPTRGRRPHQP